MTNPNGHVHAWKRVRTKDKKSYYYLCTHPECRANATRTQLWEKECACTECGTVFIALNKAFRLAKLKCNACRGPSLRDNVMTAKDPETKKEQTIEVTKDDARNLLKGLL